MATVAWAQASMPHDRSPSDVRTFDAECRSRLALLNACARALRGMGYQIRVEEIEPRDGGRPVIQIVPYSMKSFDVLREPAGGVSIRREGNRQFAHVAFMGVRVIWEIEA